MSKIFKARTEGALCSTLKHGDKPALPKKLPNILITTPESLDSLICRRPGVFVNLRAVILDEIHLLDNTFRGDQLRLLLKRIQKISASPSFSIHLLSATLSKPDEIAKRYVDNFAIVRVVGQREIDFEILSNHEEIFQFARKRGLKKILYFCNLRQSVENLANEIKELWHPYPVFAHHGSLSRYVREEAEKMMKEIDVGACVATSTLEIGIDIGDIDLIVLAEPPWSIAAMLQRLGRGNRRRQRILAVASASTDEEKQILEAMFKMVANGELSTEPYMADISVGVQQIFSNLYQHPEGLPENEFIELLSPLCTEEEVKLILGHLKKVDWIEFRGGHWFASTKLMDLGYRGRIHSNIPDMEAYKVVDVDSGKEIGTIGGFLDNVFVLARRAWQIVSIEGNIIKARRFKGKATSAIFKPRRNIGAFFYLLPPELRSH
jgi:ATP-dependent Lhr-like helicase